MVSLEELHSLERAYARLYSQESKTPYGRRYTDHELPDMYCHNFLRLDDDSLDRFDQARREEQAYRKAIGCPMVQLEYFGHTRPEGMEKLDAQQVKTQLLMSVELDQFQSRDTLASCSLVVACTPEHAQAGKKIDQIAFGSEYAAFAARRFDRKQKVYEKKTTAIEHLLLRAEGHYVGNCDLLVTGHAAKVEDIDILEEFQGRGYGRALLGYVAQRAADKGARFLALQVDESNKVARGLYHSVGMRVYDRNHIYCAPVEE